MKSGSESRNSLSVSSSARPTAKLRTSRGNLRRILRKPSIPSDSTVTFKFDQSVSAHVSRATFTKQNMYM